MEWAETNFIKSTTMVLMRHWCPMKWMVTIYCHVSRSSGYITWRARVYKYDSTSKLFYRLKIQFLKYMRLGNNEMTHLLNMPQIATQYTWNSSWNHKIRRLLLNTFLKKFIQTDHPYFKICATTSLYLPIRNTNLSAWVIHALSYNRTIVVSTLYYIRFIHFYEILL